jgi:transposase, IS30 family
LRTGWPLRKRRRRPGQRQARFTAPAVLIDLRSGQALLWQRIGDWEGDLIIGRSSQSAIGTLVDRTSRYLRLIHLPASHYARAVRDALVTVLASLPETARITLTWDQGAEMAFHDHIAPLLAEGCPSPAWPAPGSAARTRTPTVCSGSTSSSAPTCPYTPPRTLRAVEDRLNHRPRKTLG